MIYCSHGIVENHCPKKYCHRNTLDREKLETYLKNKKEKYVTLREALDGKGDAFTIDDATYSSLEADKLLRKHDHEVTIYVNPYYIENNVLYWFSILNYLLDTCLYPSLCLQGTDYSLASYREKNVFRKNLKQIVAAFPTEESIHVYLGAVFNTDLKNIDIPAHLQTFTESDILEIQKLGVDIQNHGWTHKQLNTSTPEEIDYEVLTGRVWLKNKFNIDPCYYAVPFGERYPPCDYDFSGVDCWFLLCDDLSYGSVDKRVYNRSNFKFEN